MTSNGGWCAKTAIGFVISASIRSIKRFARSEAKVALVAARAQVSTAISLTGIILDRIFDEIGIRL